MAIGGNAGDKILKPRVPTTGLSRSFSGTVPSSALSSPGSAPSSQIREKVWQQGAAPRGAYSPVGMLRGGRKPVSRQRTQYVGGRPGAVRYTTSPFSPDDDSDESWTSETVHYAPFSPDDGLEKGLRGAAYGTTPDSDASWQTLLPEAEQDRLMREGRMRAAMKGLRGAAYGTTPDSDARYQSLAPVSRPPPAFARGGQVPPGPTDTTPAWLTPGEFVVDEPHAREIRSARGQELQTALANLAGDIKLGLPPGQRSVGGRQNFAGGGTVRDESQPGYSHGGETTFREQSYDDPDESSLSEAWRYIRPVFSQSGYQGADKAPQKKTLTNVSNYAKGQGYKKGRLAHYLQDSNNVIDADGYIVRGGKRVGHISTDTGFANYQSKEREGVFAEDEAGARRRREQGWASQSKLNQQRKSAAIERGAEVRRQAGRFAREEHSVNTSQAARAALAQTSVQPLESSLAQSSRLQLRSSLQGALIESSANLQAEMMSYQAEVDAISGEMQIIQQQIGVASDDAKMSQLLKLQEENNRQLRFNQDRAADAQMRLQRAQDPGFLKSIAPALITGGMTLLGKFLFPASGVVAPIVAGASALASPRLSGSYGPSQYSAPAPAPAPPPSTPYPASFMPQW